MTTIEPEDRRPDRDARDDHLCGARGRIVQLAFHEWEISVRICQLRVRNCGAFVDLDVAVRNHLVLVGPNACGKTTLLRLIDACLAAPTQSLPIVLSPGLLRDRSKPLVVELVMDALTGGEQAAFPDESEVLPDKSVRLTVRLTATVNAADQSQVDVVREFVKPLGDTQALTNRHLTTLRWTFLRATRSADTELGQGRTGAVGRLLASVDYTGDQEMIDQTVSQANAVLERIEALNVLREQVAAALGSVYPREVEVEQLKVGVNHALELSNSLNLLLSSGDGEFLPLVRQSDGYRSLATLSLQRLAGGDSAITAIDEPEMHLHPRMQGRVARMLATEPGQRVVATHAPSIVRNFEPKDVVAFTPIGHRQLPLANVTNRPKFFSQWWVDSVIEPLTARAVAIVEGAADEALLRAVAAALSIDLDRQSITVLAVGGAENLPQACELLGPPGFQTRLAVLVDSKEAHLVHEPMGVPANAPDTELAKHGVFVAAADLEDMYCSALGFERVRQLLVASNLFTEGQLQMVTNPGQLLEFCRHKKRKVLCTLALARGLTEADAALLRPLVDAVGFATEASG